MTPNKSRFVRFFAVWLLFTALRWASAQPAAPKPYVVLVSLDGFRYDYATKYHAENLLAIGQAGTSAEALIPCFPSVTFPNHISIVTGLYPEHHGIVLNTFYDPARKQQYSRRTSAVDGSWYGGTPLWVLAEQQGIKAATMFWPASDAQIDGIRPSYWSLYDGAVPDEERIARVLNWLKLPEQQRPHFITLYLSDVDSAGHQFGPDGPETQHAVEKVDRLMGELWRGLQSTALPVNLMIVSDHGMQTLSGSVNLADFTDLSKLRVITEGPIALIYAPDGQTAAKAYRDLKRKSGEFEVYWRKQSPKAWHFRDNPRSGDIIVLATRPISILTQAPRKNPNKGEHGYDPGRFKTMRGIFYSAGPNIRQRVMLKPFVNVNVYPLIAEILGLRLPPNLDGNLKVLQSIYTPATVRLLP